MLQPRIFLIILILMSLNILPCFGQTITLSSSELNLLKQKLTDSLNELHLLNELVPVLKKNLKTANEQLASYKKSGIISDNSLKTLESQLTQALTRQAELKAEAVMLSQDLTKHSISLSELRKELQTQKAKQIEQAQNLIEGYEDQIKRKNTFLVILGGSSGVLLILTVVFALAG